MENSFYFSNFFILLVLMVLVLTVEGYEGGRLVVLFYLYFSSADGKEMVLSYGNFLFIMYRLGDFFFFFMYFGVLYFVRFDRNMGIMFSVVSSVFRFVSIDFESFYYSVFGSSVKKSKLEFGSKEEEGRGDGSLELNISVYIKEERFNSISFVINFEGLFDGGEFDRGTFDEGRTLRSKLFFKKFLLF